MGLLRRLTGVPDPAQPRPGQPLTAHALAGLIVAGAHDYSFLGPDPGLRRLKAAGVQIQDRAFRTRVELTVFYSIAFLIPIFKRYGRSAGTSVLNATADQLTEMHQKQFGRSGRDIQWHEVASRIRTEMNWYVEQVLSTASPEGLARFGRQALEIILGRKVSEPLGPAALIQHWEYVRQIAGVVLDQNPLIEV